MSLQQLFKELDIPYTREEVIDFDWMGDPPDPWTPEDEMNLPPDLQDWSLFEEVDGDLVSKEWDESQHPRDEDGKFTFSGGDDGGDESSSISNEREPNPKNYGFKTDNPGGEWLKAEQRQSAKDMAGEGNSHTPAALKGLSLSLSVTATMGSKGNMSLPTTYLRWLRGINDEKRGPGDYQYDQLLKKVQAEGWHPEYPILIMVNYKGQAFISEGNTRVAVAATIGQKSVPAEVRWVAGGEEAGSGLTPERAAELADIVKVSISNEREPVAVGAESDPNASHDFLSWGGQLDRAGDEAIFSYIGKDVTKDAAEAVVKLGEERSTPCEFGAIVMGGGQVFPPPSSGKILVGVVRGRASTVNPNDTIANMMHNNPAGFVEFHHNHPHGPHTGVLSTGDIEWLNASKMVTSISSYDSSGGHFKASIPGRSADNPSSWKWTPHVENNGRVEITSDRLFWLSEKIDEALVADASMAETLQNENELAFLSGHAMLVGLDAAGVIKYEFELSPVQQSWITKYRLSFEKAVAVASREAKGMKWEKVNANH